MDIFLDVIFTNFLFFLQFCGFDLMFFYIYEHYSLYCTSLILVVYLCTIFVYVWTYIFVWIFMYCKTYILDCIFMFLFISLCLTIPYLFAYSCIVQRTYCLHIYVLIICLCTTIFVCIFMNVYGLSINAYVCTQW